MDTAKLRDQIKGKVIVPRDQDYDKARVVFNGAIDKKPAVIIQAKDVSDVVETIKLAKKTGLEFSIRSGGHSAAGHSTNNGGIVLDLRNMRSLKINHKDRTAWVEPGMTAGEYSEAVGRYGFVTGFGDTSSVGIGGITLGGGIGFLVRKFGMAIDNLLAAEIVTANGERLQVDAKHHSELFWAIRGGGGNFGVAIRFKFRLEKLPEAYGGMLVLPAEPKVLADFMDLATKAPEELSLIANVMATTMPLPFLPKEFEGKAVIMVLLVYAGQAKDGEKVLTPFKKLAKPLADMLKPMKYHEIFTPEDESYRPKAVSRNMFTKKIDLKLAKQIIDELGASDATLRVVQLRPLGGAMGRIPNDDTAFAHRRSPIMANVAAFYDGPKDKMARETWVKGLAKKLYQNDDAVYIGFMANEGKKRLHDAYPDKTWERLQAVKKQYDPGNLFKLNINVTPSGG